VPAAKRSWQCGSLFGSWRKLVAAGLIVCVSAGCVQRRLTIRSNPPGALVYIDDYQIGTTPVSTDYVYYGNRKFRVIKDGYETMVVKQWIPPPWYEILPFEFVSENLIPFDIRDHRTLDFKLTPQVIVPTDQLLGRADALRTGSRSESFVPPPAVKLPTRILAPPWIPRFWASPPPPDIQALPSTEPVQTSPPASGAQMQTLPPPADVPAG
jgi:hypothetical protein